MHHYLPEETTSFDTRTSVGLALFRLVRHIGEVEGWKVTLLRRGNG